MHTLDVGALAAGSVPVLCVDTCSLLDIMRDPTRDDARPHERQAAVDLVTELEAGAFVCLIADQVELEFMDHDQEVQDDALRALQKLRNRVEQANLIHAVFLPSVAVNLVHLQDLVGPARIIIERWIAAATGAPVSNEIHGRAMNRVNKKIAPAQRGKDSAKDCVVLETYLYAVKALRSAGMPSKVVLLSSNTKEYLTNSKVLQPGIASDFAPLNMTYAPNMSAAKAMLGF